MDEATFGKWISSRLRRRLRSQKGQAMVEYILVLFLALLFTRFVFFNQEFGFKALLDKTMLRVGAYLEQNLKTGTRNGAEQGERSLEPYAGTGRWSN
jgi:hypothetical protein